ncbi:MAG: tetratricopeptide repeat protein [Deltaproteobacteria bacterium]|nr:tetratricopeptide repeat protein [Deltaproteobacteria bacterium]
MKRQCVVIGAMAVICAILYSGIVHAPFILDDNSFIVNAPQIHVKNLSFSTLKTAATTGIPAHRPLPKISFALNYYFGGYLPFGYHLVNIAIHIFTAFFVYLLFTQVLFLLPAGGGNEKKIRTIALAAAMIWMVHPLQTESVTYVCQRMTSLSALFFVSSLWCYGEARIQMQRPAKKWKSAVFFTGAVLSGCLALMSKENAATLPVFILFYEWLFFDRVKGNRRLWISAAACMIVFSGIALFYLGPHPIARITGSYANRMFDLSQRLFTEARIVIYYIGLIFFAYPSRLNLDYAYPVSTSILNPPTTVLSITAICALVVLGIYAARKDKILGLAIFWFLGNLIIESSFVGLELVFEHRTYLPSMFLVLWIIRELAGKIRDKRVWIPVVCAVFILFSIFTYQRNKVWADPVSLWADCVKKSPGKVRPNFNLGCFLEKRRDYISALGYFAAANRIKPDFDQTHYHMGYCLGRLKRYPGAEKEFMRALALNPKNADARNNLGNVFAETGRPEAATAEYKKAVILSPKDASIRINLAGVLADIGKPDEAVFQYQKALLLAPENVGALNDLGYLLLQQGLTDEARHLLEKAVLIDPANGAAHARLGDLFQKTGDTGSAIRHYNRALLLNPIDAQTLYNLGIAYYKLGRLDDACGKFEHAHALAPGLVPPAVVRNQCEKFR